MADENKEKSIALVEKKTIGTSVNSLICSVLKKVSVIGAVYLTGYFNLSVAWLIAPVAFLVIREQNRKEKQFKRNIHKAAALANEKDVILARIDDLPAWVFFPDVERVEWLNKILKHVWPNVNHYTRDLVRDSIQPSIKKSVEKYKLSGFKFERIILGSIPPRIGGIKVYDKNVARNEIIMDLDLSYAGDCDINFVVSGVRGGIKDFQLDGMLRVVMKPIIPTMPFIGGLQIFFLNNPTVDFNLVGIADLLDMPGLSDILRKIIIEQIASMMVLPNKFPIKLSDMIEPEDLKIPEPEGVLRVHVIEAKHLMKKDIGMLGKGKSDPYAVVTLGAQEFKTKTITNSVDPKWDFWCELKVSERDGQQLFIHVWDLDDTSDDEVLGRASIEVANIVKKGEDDLWVTLEQAKHGMVHLRLAWLTLSSEISDLKAALEETQMLRVTSMSTAVLIVYVDSLRHLPQARTSSKPDPYTVLNVGNDSQQTQTIMRSSDPVYEQGFTFLVANPESDTLYITVRDQKTDTDLGQLVYQLSSLCKKEKLKVDKQPFTLSKAGPESKIILSMRLRILKNEKPLIQSEQPNLTRQESARSTGSGDRNFNPSNLETISNSLPQASLNDAEEVFEDSSVPLLSATPPVTPNSNIVHRTPSVSSSGGDFGLGRIQLTLRYSVARQRLIIVVHKIANLPLKDPSNIPDPYVKLYLLPDRSKDTKRKTQTIKDNCNPVYDESFEYVISQGELANEQLEVTVCTQKQLFYSSSNVMGQVIVPFADYNLTQPYTAWFDLQPEKN